MPLEAKPDDRIWRISSASVCAIIFLILLKNVYFPASDLLFPNSDFEYGNLANWSAEGNAFQSQPVFGDNSYDLNMGASHVVGNYWIGTFHNRHTPQEPAGMTQGDGPMGTLNSVAFKIKQNKITFLIGGGDCTDNESVCLLVDGKKVMSECGTGAVIKFETMHRVIWNVSRWKNKNAVLQIVDHSSGAWGHISADDFRYKRSL
jgi:hypothetical protein